MKDRLRYLIQQLGVTNESLAQKLAVSPSGIAHILNGRNKPSIDFLGKLMQAYPHINIEWLITGDGSWNKNDAGAATYNSTSPTLPDSKEVSEQDDEKSYNEKPHRTKSDSNTSIEQQKFFSKSFDKTTVRDEEPAVYNTGSNNPIPSGYKLKNININHPNVRGIIIELENGQFRYLQPEKETS